MTEIHPTDSDGQDRNRVAFATLTTVLLLIGSGIYIAVLLVAGEPRRLFGTVPFTIIGIAGWILLRRKQLSWACHCLAIGGWACSVFALVMTQGLTGTTVGILMLVLVLASWLSGPIPGIALTIASPPVFFLLAHLEVTGWPISLGNTVTPYQRALVLTFSAVVSGALGYFGATSLRERFSELLKSQNDLSSKLADLQLRDAALRSSQNRFEALFRSSPSASVITNAEGFIVDCNQLFEMLIGNNREEIIHRSLLDFGIWQSLADLRNTYEQIAREGKLSAFETTWRATTGKTLTLLIYGARLEVNSERSILFHIVDISERKRYEADLGSVLEEAGDAIWITDAQGHFLLANPAACTLSAHTLEELQTLNFTDLVPDEYRDDLDEHLKRLMTEKIIRSEGFLKRKDGKIVCTELTAKRLQDGRFMIIGRDLTENKRTEAQLRKLSQAVEQSPEDVIITNLDAEIEYVNDAFLTRSGYLRDEVIGRNPRMLQSGKSPKGVHLALWNTLAQGNTWKGELCNRAKDGREYVQFAIITPIKQADGKITHYVAIQEDITERKQITNELDQHRHHLMELVQTRTRELAQAKEEADSANKAKSAFLANMSHEIRTPLNAVLGFAEIGMRENDGRKTAKTCRNIYEAGDHLLGIINDILDLSKIEAGRMMVERQSFHLPKVVERVIDILSEKARAKGVSLSVNFIADPATPSFVLGDPLRLRQILLNLLGNAIKFTQRGQVVLTIVREGDDSLFRVADTGAGITQEHLARLFQPFEQADNSTTRTHGGSGLGLAISRSLAALMGGEISVASTLGQGSVFTVRLPLPEGLPVPDQPIHSLSDSGRHLSGLRVLAAEDIHLNRIILEDLMVTQGASIILVEDGRQALDAVQTHGADAFDIVLMDIQMPVLDGYDATRLIHEFAPNLPVVGLTAYALNDERNQCLAAGMAAHVTKPIRKEELIAAILDHAARQPAISATETSARPLASGEPLAVKAAQEPDWIDWTVLAVRYDHRQTFINKLIEASLESHGETAEQLRLALSANDRETVRRLAHALISIAGNLTATKLADLAHQAERSAAQDLDDFKSLTEKLASGTEELMAVLHTRLNRDKTA